MSALPCLWPPVRPAYVPLGHASQEVNAALAARHHRTQEFLRAAIVAAYPTPPEERAWLTVTLPREEGDASEHPRAETVMVPSLRELAESASLLEMREEWIDDAGRDAIRARVYADYGVPLAPVGGAS